MASPARITSHATKLFFTLTAMLGNPGILSQLVYLKCGGNAVAGASLVVFGSLLVAPNL
jgi:hypothetical protein